MTPFEMVKEFHETFNAKTGDLPPLSTEVFKMLDKDTKNLISLRMSLINEEFLELMNATSRENLIKEACDLLYVVYGLGATYNLPLDEAFRRVHESNMSKVGEDGKPIFRSDGKILKGPNYKEPDLKDL